MAGYVDTHIHTRYFDIIHNDHLSILLYLFLSHSIISVISIILISSCLKNVCMFFLLTHGNGDFGTLSSPFLKFLKPCISCSRLRKVFWGMNWRDGGRWMSLAVTND